MLMTPRKPPDGMPFIEIVSAWSRRVTDGGGTAAAFLNEETVFGRNVVIEGNQLGCYVHVDDGVILSEANGSQPLCNEWMHMAADALTDYTAAAYLFKEVRLLDDASDEAVAK